MSVEFWIGLGVGAIGVLVIDCIVLTVNIIRNAERGAQ